MTSVKQAIPRLRSLLSKHANENHVFPLFSAKRDESIWKSARKKRINLEREAAILVPLVTFEGMPSLLFTTRSSRLPTHASEVSFPGGHFDEGIDRTLEDTAIREAREELLGDDYPWERVQILGRASPLPSLNGMPVTPVIGVFPEDIDNHTFPGSSDEVEDVFCVSLEELLEVETSQHSERFCASVPVFQTPNGKKIWGLTAIVTRPLLHKIFKPAFFDA